MPGRSASATPLAHRTASANMAPVRDPLPRGTALLRGLIGWIVLGVGTGIAIGVTAALKQPLGLSGAARSLIQAILMTLIVVPTILLLRRRMDRRPVAGLGWGRRITAPLALGVGVGVLSGLIAWGPALATGWIRVDSIDLSAFAGFLVINGAALLLYEALPEELALRGYMWTNLRDGWGPAVATVLTTLLFPFTGLISTAVAAAVTAVFGTTTTPITFFPADPVAYIVQLSLFGLALIAARRVPIEGALFVAVSFHWTQLTITRALLNDMNWVDSGWEMTFIQPDAIALVLVHIVLGGLLFVAARKLLERRAGASRALSPSARRTTSRLARS